MGKSIYCVEHEELCRLLRQLRKNADLTQAQLADKIGFPQSFVSKYESGERRLDLVELRQVCTALKTSVAEFATRWEKTLNET